MLFTGTIRSNIKYGNPSMSDEDMIKAATIAQATEFIESKPKNMMKKYHKVVQMYLVVKDNVYL